MANDPIDVCVDVIEDSTRPTGFRFETTDLPMDEDGVLYFRSCKKNQDFHVHYRLQGFDGYTFPSNLADALWVRAGSKSDCPTQSSTWGQFGPHSVSNGARTLVVKNKNSSRAQFGYTLRITNDGGGSYVSLDPGGVNENGGYDLSSYSRNVVLAAVGGVALTFGALYTLGMLRLG